jgi:hypothetical protein
LYGRLISAGAGPKLEERVGVVPHSLHRRRALPKFFRVNGSLSFCSAMFGPRGSLRLPRLEHTFNLCFIGLLLFVTPDQIDSEWHEQKQQ